MSARVNGEDFVRPHILDLDPYTPILPINIIAEQLGMNIDDIAKLDANENPYGPSKGVLEALSEMKFQHIYPDPESRRLRSALALECNIPPEHLLVGCGADELIDLILRAVLDPKDCIINTPPTFGMYSFDCSINDGNVIDVPRGGPPHFKIDLEQIKEKVALHRPKVIFITSPNNPDGSIISQEEFDYIINLPVLVVLDEAYIEFSSNSQSRISDVTKHNNLIVLRTFSKRAALAGLRIGYGAFPLGIVEYMWRIKQPYNVSVAAEIAALAAINDSEYYEGVEKLLIQEKERLFHMLNGFEFLEPYPSESNFILCRVMQYNAKELKDFLYENGVIVRYYSKPEELASCFRVSVGKPEHTIKLQTLLTAFEEKKMSV
jgi:histidinol-phosphate aminotransferase